MKRRTKAPPRNSSRSPDWSESERYQDKPQEKSATSPFSSMLSYSSLAILAAVFILGIGIGIAFSSTASFTPATVASREVIDRSAPNPELCAQNGASAITMDLRAFVTLSPFNVYISQPSMQPGCVLRSTNFTILERFNRVDQTQINQCRRRLNTFGYTGDLADKNDNVRVDCIYQNDAAQNLFLDQPGVGAPPPETSRF